MFYPPVLPYLLKVWQLMLSAMRFANSKLQEVFDWFMNKLVVWLCRYYMGHGYSY